MSRPASYIIPATFLSISLVFAGCKSIYSDMYSPRRSHYIPVKEKPKPAATTPLLDEVAPAPGSDLPPLGLPPAAPTSAPPPEANPAPPPDGTAPMIPGL